MTDMQDDNWNALLSMLRETLGIETNMVTPASRLVDDLGAIRLDLVDEAQSAVLALAPPLAPLEAARVRASAERRPGPPTGSRLDRGVASDRLLHATATWWRPNDPAG